MTYKSIFDELTAIRHQLHVRAGMAPTRDETDAVTEAVMTLDHAVVVVARLYLAEINAESAAKLPSASPSPKA